TSAPAADRTASSGTTARAPAASPAAGSVLVPSLARVPLSPRRRGNEGAAALPGDDQASLAQYLHGVPDGLVGHAELLRERALGGQLVRELADLDSRGDDVGHLNIGGLIPAKRVDLAHLINVDALRAA